MSPTNTTHSRASSRSHQTSRPGDITDNDLNANQHNQPTNTDASKPPHDSTFSADQWTRNLKHENWAAKWAHPPAQGQAQTSPTRRPHSSNTKRARPQNPYGSGVNIASAQPQGQPNRANASHSYDDLEGDAMDIDPPPVERRPSAPANAQPSGGPRAVFVEPHRPEWRSQPDSADQNAPNQNGTEPEASNFNMSNLKNQPPLNLNTSGGIGNLNDLGSNLPFQSQPSSAHPGKSPLSPPSSRADLPKAPQAPLAPAKLSRDEWMHYLERMKEYVSKWNRFNAGMVSAFQSRAQQAIDMERGHAGGAVDGWLAAIGETSNLKGWDSHVKSLQEDERLRMHWNAACDGHRSVILQHGRLREKVMSEGLSVS